jgi:hypothetical protein
MFVADICRLLSLSILPGALSQGKVGSSLGLRRITEAQCDIKVLASKTNAYGKHLVFEFSMLYHSTRIEKTRSEKAVCAA